MREVELRICREHGDDLCFVNPDGSHVPRSACTCFVGGLYNSDCPVLAHRRKASRGKRGGNRGGSSLPRICLRGSVTKKEIKKFPEIY